MSISESNMFNSTSEEEEYEVERILDHRRRGGKLQYEIKWKDYSDEDNTWENEANVFAIDLINTYWDSRGGQEALKAARSGKKVKKVNSPGIKDKGKQSRRASSSSSSPAAAGVKRTRTPDISLPSSSGTSERLSKQARTEDSGKENEDKINTSNISFYFILFMFMFNR
ncbi:chromo domain-like protein [Circinella umbellata]|nr:chromo domain-like protein [Circinella umbellata]